MSASTESKVLLVQPCTLRDWLTVDHGEVLLGSGSVWWEVRMKLEGKKSSKERKLEGKKRVVRSMITYPTDLPFSHL